MVPQILTFPAAIRRPQSVPAPTLRMELLSIRERLAVLALMRLNAAPGVRR